MYVSKYVCKYVCKYVGMYACRYEGMYLCMYVGMFVRRYVGKQVCRYVGRYVCMYVLAQMLDATLKYLPRTCADPCCYVIGFFLVHAQTVDVTIEGHVTRRQLIQRYKDL